MDKILRKPYAAVIGALICTALWGTAYPVIKYSYAVLALDSTADKLVFAGMRFLIAGLAVFAASWIKDRRLPAVPRDMCGKVALYGAVQTGLMYILNYIGVANTTATKTSVITAASAFFGVIAAPLFFRDERLTALKVIGAVVGFSGIVLVNLDGLSLSFSLAGEGLVLAAAVMNTVGSFIAKRISGSRVFEVTAYQLLTGSVMILAAGFVTGGSLRLSGEAVLLTLWLAFVSAAAFTLWTALLVRYDAGRILVFNLFIPFFGALWSYVILGETQITQPAVMAGFAVTAAGIVMVNFTKNRRKV